MKANIVKSLRNGLALAAVLALGYMLGNGRPVKAAADTFEFQLAGVNPESALLVYQPATRTVYVYRGATTGSANLQCSMKFILGTPGSAIQRVNCDVATMH